MPRAPAPQQPLTRSVTDRLEHAQDPGTAALRRAVPLPLLHFGAGVVAGMAATLVTQPADVVKTRLQLQVRGAGEVLRYSGLRQAVTCMWRVRGARGAGRRVWHLAHGAGARIASRRLARAAGGRVACVFPRLGASCDQACAADSADMVRACSAPGLAPAAGAGCGCFCCWHHCCWCRLLAPPLLLSLLLTPPPLTAAALPPCGAQECVRAPVAAGATSSAVTRRDVVASPAISAACRASHAASRRHCALRRVRRLANERLKVRARGGDVQPRCLRICSTVRAARQRGALRPARGRARVTHGCRGWRR